jgi:hypothetical protein
MSFEEKIMGGNKIKNVLIISEAKLRLMSPLCIKVYVGNTPPIHCIIMMGHLLAAPEGYVHYTRKIRHRLPAICGLTLPSNDYLSRLWHFLMLKTSRDIFHHRLLNKKHRYLTECHFIFKIHIQIF